MKITKEEELNLYFDVLDPKLDYLDMEKCTKILKVIKDNDEKIYTNTMVIPALIYIVNNKDYTQNYLTNSVRTTLGLYSSYSQITALTKSINNILLDRLPEIRSEFCSSHKMRIRVMRNKLKIIKPKIFILFKEYINKLLLNDCEKEICRYFLCKILYHKFNILPTLEISFFKNLFPFIVYYCTADIIDRNDRETLKGYYCYIIYKRVISVKNSTNEINDLLKLGNIFNEETNLDEYKKSIKQLIHYFHDFAISFSEYFNPKNVMDLNYNHYRINKFYTIDKLTKKVGQLKKYDDYIWLNQKFIEKLLVSKKS
jgi:hypothetical protein